jgi:hypothetical protein
MVTGRIAVDSGRAASGTRPGRATFAAAGGSAPSSFYTSITPCPRAAGAPNRPLPLIALADFTGYCEQRHPSHSRISQDRPRPLPSNQRGLRRGRKPSRFLGTAEPLPCVAIRQTQTVEASARASGRAIARERPGPHPEARPERRRHVVKRRAAVAAYILWRALHAQPVTPRGALRIQTLYRPTGKILHLLASQNVQEKRPVKLAGLCAGASSVSREIYTISRGTFPRGQESRV